MLKITLPLLLLASSCLAANLVDVLINEPKASTLVQQVVSAGLVDALKAGTFTVFAPTDAAFAAADLSPYAGDPSALVNILLYHVLPGKVLSTDLRNELKAKTLANDTVRINLYTHNKINTVNGVKISEVDRLADNGVIHFIDEVLIPPPGNIVDVINLDSELSTLLTAVSAAGIANEFLADPLTVFAPTNAAFAALDQNDLQKLLGDQGRLKETLEYHAVAHTLYSKGLWNHEFPRSTDSHDDRLHVRVNSDGVSVNGGKVIEADLNASNGVVHKIDKVLIPARVLIWLRGNIIG